MEKYVYNLTDFAHRVSADGKTWENSDNIKKFKLPDIEPGAEEVNGYSGLNGTINVIDWANIVYITGMLKKIPGGDASKGESNEKEFTYGINTYKLTRKNDDGTEQTIIDYDPINKVLVLGGNDFGSKLNTALASF